MSHSHAVHVHVHIHVHAHVSCSMMHDSMKLTHGPCVMTTRATTHRGITISGQRALKAEAHVLYRAARL